MHPMVPPRVSGYAGRKMSDLFDVVPAELVTPRLRLRALRDGDVDAVYAYAFDSEVARFLSWPAHSPRPFAQGLVQVITQPRFLAWAITLPMADRAIGMIFLHSLNREHRKAEMAFNLARSFWGRGLTTEAARLVADFGFRQLGLHRIEATCMPENIASRRVLEKIGMQHEGRMRHSHRRYDGFHDMDLFALLASSAQVAV
jgi:ribosomal-protein-alanine N-acetyltransferase